MGKKSPPAPPPVPDPREIAETDAEFNRIDQFTPQGSLTYSGDSRNQATLTLSPEQQAIYEAQTGLDLSFLGLGADRLGSLDPNPIDLGQFGDIQGDAGFMNDAGLQGDAGLLKSAGLLNNAGLNQADFSGQQGAFDPSQYGLGPGDLPQLQNSLDLSGLPEIPQDFNQLRSDQEDAYFQRGRRLLNPEFNRQEDRLTQTLANQGLFAGDEAAGDQQQIFGENRNRAFQDLADQSILQGGNEAGRELSRILGTRQQGYGEALGQGQFANQAALGEFGAGLGAFGAATQGLQNFMGAEGFNNLVSQQGFENYNNAQQQGFQNFNNAQQQGLQNYNSAQQQGFQNFNTAAQQDLINSNAARSQGLNEQSAVRSNQFNELASLLGLQQTQQPGLSSFFAPSQVDFLGAQGLSSNQANQNYQGELSYNNAGLGGLFGLGASVLSGAGAAGGFSSLFG